MQPLLTTPMRLWLDPPPVSTTTPLSRDRIVEAAVAVAQIPLGPETLQV